MSGGLLVGVTRYLFSGHCDVVAYRLSDGGRQWLVSMPDDVLSLRRDGGQLLVIDQSRPSLALDAISLPEWLAAPRRLHPGKHRRPQRCERVP